MTPRPCRQVAHRLALALALALGGWCTPAAALAEAQLRVVLEYTADPVLACPSAAELSASVTRQLGYDAFTTDPSEQRLRIAISKLPDGAEAELEWIDRQQHSEGERRLTSKGSCEELASNLAFAAAVQIQLHAASSPPAPPEPTPPVVAQPPAPEPRVPAAPPKKRTVSTRRVLVGVGALARHGLTPGITPGLRLFGALSQKGWLVELSAHATLPSQLDQANGAGFTARELGTSLAPCWRLAPLGLCGVGTLSLLHARGHGVDQIRSPSSLTAGVGGRLQLAWPELERFGVVIQAEALVLLLPREVLLNQQTAWQTEPVAFTAILDFAAIFR